MKRAVITLFVFCGLFITTPVTIYAQRLPKCVKVATTKRPIILLLDLEKLNRFYQNFEQGVNFEAMKTAKWELAYYLLAQEKNGSRIFAFELEQKGKRLFLNKYFTVQSCDMGDLSLDTFLKSEGKISGCRMGNHNSNKLPEKKRR